MSSPLFREEVLAARRMPWLGPISIAQGPSTWLLAAVACVAATLVLGLLAFGEYTRRTRVVGQLVPSSGLVTLQAPHQGMLSRVAVAEADRVDAGAPLVRIEVPSGTDRRPSAFAAVDGALDARAEALDDRYEAERAQLRSRQASLVEQRQAIEEELASLAAETALRRDQLALAEAAEARVRELHARQMVTLAQWQQQQLELLEQRATLQQALREAGQLRRQLAAVSLELASVPLQIDALSAAAERDRVSLRQERIETETRGEVVLAAPVAGVVSALLGHAGQSVQEGQPILTLLPDGARLEAHLLVPSRAIGFIAPGDPVLLRYQAFPYQKFGQARGEVLRVSRSALSRTELAALAVGGSATEPVYRVVVGLQHEHVLAFGRAEPLKSGMLLEADVLGETRRLWEWLLEPLISIQQPLPSAAGRRADASEEP